MTPTERQQVAALAATVEALEQQADAVKGMAVALKASLQGLMLGAQRETVVDAPEARPPEVRASYYGAKQRMEGSNRLVSREEVLKNGTTQHPVSPSPMVSEQPPQEP